MLIVVIAGVAFIPDLLDGQKNTIKEDFKKIPPRPESSESPIVRDFPLSEVNDVIDKAPTATDEVTSELNDSSAEVTETVEVKTSEEVRVGQEDFAETQIATVTVDKVETPKAAQGQFESSAWVLRLGTFRNKPNVDALLSKLEEAGFTTFVKPVEAKAGTLYRVFVGPELEKSKLEKAQKTLKELTGLNGKVTQFEPVN